MGNLSHNQKKMKRAYLLKPSRIKGKAALIPHTFLERKAVKYTALKRGLENISGALKEAAEAGVGNYASDTNAKANTTAPENWID
jgi:hypothetical protein